MKKTVLASFAAALLCLPGNARNVYAYLTGNYSPVMTVQSIKKIVFNASGIEFQTQYGKSSTAAFADMDYFRFYKTPVPVGVDAISDNALSIALEGNNLRIESSSSIDYISVCSVQGILVAQTRPCTKSYAISTSSYAPGVYLVKVISDGKELTKKIIK